MAAAVTIYTKPGCPYCARALALLERKGVQFDNIVASNHPEKKAEMVQRSNGKATYPQIFIGDRHIGGSDDMLAMEERGELDSLLTA
jgi:glutaredoxin 3